MNLIGRKALFAMVLCCLAACSKSQKSEPGSAPSAAATPSEAATASTSAAAAASTGAAPLAQGLPASDRIAVPMKLVLNGPNPPPEKGDFVLAVDIVVAEPLTMPLTLHVELPAGAKLAKGVQDEPLALNQAGTTTRLFTIHIDAPLKGPVVVTAETRNDAGVVTMRSTKKYAWLTAVTPATSGSGEGTAPSRGPAAPR